MATETKSMFHNITQVKSHRMDPETDLPGKGTLFGNDGNNVPWAVTNKHMSSKQVGRRFFIQKVTLL